MNKTLETIYNIYMSNCKSVLKKNFKPQYHPHKCFSSADGKRFEENFPKLIAEEDLVSLKSLIDQMRSLKFGQNVISYKTYCNQFLDFLVEVTKKNGNSYVYKNIFAELQKAYQIDGVNALVEALGGENEFIRKAIKESYFFSPDLVIERFDRICDAYQFNKPIPARWRQERKKGLADQCGYGNCDIDVNGNAKVKSVILALTGYTISSGNSVFMNYKISHIWGNAQDPRYFTNMWNIVFVPAWANDLLDKAGAPEGSFASKMLNTYKKICMEFYNMKELHWENLDLDNSPGIEHKNDVIKGSYEFNVIAAKGNMRLGPISKAKLKIVKV